MIKLIAIWSVEPKQKDNRIVIIVERVMSSIVFRCNTWDVKRDVNQKWRQLKFEWNQIHFKLTNS